MKPRVALLLALAITPALLLVGCGEDEALTPLDTTPPLAPVVEGANKIDGVASIWWKANTEPDLAGYYVYAVENGVIKQINTSPTTERFASIESSGTVRLYVTAVDFSGNESGSSSVQQVTEADPGVHEGPGGSGYDDPIAQY